MFSQIVEQVSDEALTKLVQEAIDFVSCDHNP